MRRYLVLLTLLAGCDLYWNNNGDDTCQYGYGATPAANQQFRNPDTGQCETFGGYGCDPSCGPCPPSGAISVAPDWGACYGSCDSLPEDGCLAAAGCYAAYDDAPTPNALVAGPPTFRGCYAVAPSGPVEGGGCTALNAHDCSRHDDCSAVYIKNMTMTVSSFEKCIPEPVAGCANVDCGSGSHCENQCYPTGGGTLVGNDTGQCQAMCVPDQYTCANVDCGGGYTCVETCNTMSPSGGVGQCYPQCVPLAACETLGSETECSARGDCTPVYHGDDCTCLPGSCQCNILTYERCESLSQPL